VVLRRRYDIRDTICSISLGATQLLFDMTLRNFAFLPYLYVYHRWRLFDIPADSWLTYISLILFVDMGYYWMHRSAHEFHFMWVGQYIFPYLHFAYRLSFPFQVILFTIVESITTWLLPYVKASHKDGIAASSIPLLRFLAFLRELSLLTLSSTHCTNSGYTRRRYGLPIYVIIIARIYEFYSVIQFYDNELLIS
jgi:hypothetical protein